MYLSRITFAGANLRAIRAVSDPYEMHRLVWSAFPDRENGGPGRILYRLEYPRRSSSAVALVQSEKQPRWELVADDCTLATETKQISLSFETGRLFRFRLRANPTRRVGDKGDRLYGRRVGVHGEENQLNWLRRKADAGGFEIVEARVSEKQTGRGRKPRKDKESGKNEKPWRDMTFLSVTFDGLLRIADAEAFSQTFACGIGPAKGFGFGLISLARA